MTDGATVSAAGPVMNCEVTTGSSLPATSDGSIDRVMSELAGSGTCGTIRTLMLLPANWNVTGTCPAGLERITLSAVTESGLMISLNPMRTEALMPTPVIPLAGTIDVIDGAVVSV